jgi:hypothetical protein
MQSPKLRTVEKYQPPYPLNKFPEHFAVNLGREVIYLLASRGKDARLEGQDWEEIFARLIGAEWKPSNVGLDDIVLESPKSVLSQDAIHLCIPLAIKK